MRAVPKDRTYLKNVTPKTIIWYQLASQEFLGTIPPDKVRSPTISDLQH